MNIELLGTALESPAKMLLLLVVVVMLIGRLYKQVSEKPTYYWAFLAPIALLGVAAARYAFLDQLGGDLLGDLMSVLGGLLLIGMLLILYRRMVLRQ